MNELHHLLTPIEARLDQLLLDPNNPRFAELGEFESSNVPESRVAEPKVQEAAFKKMKSPKFDVNELRDTIKAVGFLPMDRIVVRKVKNDKKTKDTQYLVIEGNRRVAALKWLQDLQNEAKETFTDEQMYNFTHLPALLLDHENAPEFINLVLPGLRHVSGIKQWGAYQQARTVYILRNSGQTPQDVAQSLGLSTRVANQLWRSFLALEQMRSDEEAGELVEAQMFSYFEEIMKVPSLREWLNWSDEEKKFMNANRVREIYSWMLGDPVEDDDDGEREDKKLPEAKSIRRLGKFIEDEKALAIFRAPGGTLERAESRYEADHQPEWQGSIIVAEEVLSSLSVKELRLMNNDDEELLRQLQKRIAQTFKDREAILSSN